MHCICQIITKGPPTNDQIAKILEPYDQCSFYDRYWDPVQQDHRDIPPEAYPAFLCDYATIWEAPTPGANVQIGECFAMIDRQGRAHVRKWWNGQNWIDQKRDFEYWIQRIKRELGPHDYVTTVNYHY